MSALIIPNTITNGTAADGNAVAANFTAIKSWADGSAMEKTGATMTGQLLLSGPPTDPLGAATRAYVDAYFPTTSANIGDGQVGTLELADGAVTNAKVAAATIDATRLASTIKPLVVCTSTTRPANVSPTMIYETDKDRIRVYDGTTWAYVAGNGPRVTLSRSTAQSCATAATTDITWPTENADADNMHVANSATVTAVEAGVYSIAWGLDVTATVGGFGYSAILNAGGKTYSVNCVPAGAGTTSVSGCITLPLAVNAAVKLSVNNGTGASVNVVGDFYMTLMCR